MFSCSKILCIFIIFFVFFLVGCFNENSIDYKNNNYDMYISDLERETENASPELQIKLGNKFFRGYGVNKDEQRAFKWYKKILRGLS